MTATDQLRTARDHLLSFTGHHDKAVEEFVWPAFARTPAEGEQFCWAQDWFDSFARGNNRPGLIIIEEDGSRSETSFAELVDSSDQLAHWLAGMGIGRGDAVIVMLGNQVELWQAMLAVMKLGAVIMPTTTAVGSSDLADRIRRGSAKLIICNPADAEKLFGEGKPPLPGDYRVVTTADFEQAWQQPATPVGHPGTAATDPVLLYFTSGTTSRPKLVEHTQVSYPVGHLTTMFWLGLRPGDVHLNISSPGWAKHAWSCFFAPWLGEATVLVYNYARFDPTALLRVLKEEGVTTFCAPPTVWRMLINADLSGGPGTLREVIGAGEPLNPEVIEQIRAAWGLTIRDGFGQTETTALVGNTSGSVIKPGSMGRPLPGVPVVLVDPDTGRPSSTGEGEICLDLAGDHGLRPLNLMTGYQGDEERNSAAMEGGYYHTGDVATMDADGYITYVGRTDDVFKASDYKISPFELESVLIEHPAVAEAAIVPAPDPVRLAVPKAYIALAPGHEPTRDTALSILSYAREHLPPYLRVRRLEFYDLPKTISGKIRRVELRRREDAHSGDPIGTEFREDAFPELRA